MPITGRALRIAKWGLGALVLLLLADCLGLPGFVIDFGGNLLLGWGFVLWTSAPLVMRSGTGLALVGGVAVFGLAWWATRRNAPLGRSLAAGAAVGAIAALAVLAGCAGLGIVRSVVWLGVTEEPRFAASKAGSRVVRRTQAAHNLKRIAFSWRDASEAQSRLPAGGTFDARGRGLHGWLTHLLPFLEQQRLYDQVVFDRPWDDPANAAVYRTSPTEFLTPRLPTQSGRGNGLAYYALNARFAQPGRPRDLAAITDGAANTILAGEVVERVPEWGQPANWRDPELGINQVPTGFGGSHDKVAVFAMADGSVRTISASVDPRVLRALSTPAAGDNVDDHEVRP
jgi:hypothetical protein